jgi:hypothetical protein
MTNQTFTVAGVSTTASGVRKARFGNDLVGRIKKLKDNTDMNLMELPKAMTKVEAVTYLLEKDEFKTVENRDALTHVIFRNTPKKTVSSVQNTPADFSVSKADDGFIVTR